MKKNFLIILMLSSSVFAARRVIPPTREKLIESFGSVRQRELFIDRGELYMKDGDVEKRIFSARTNERIFLPTLTIKSVQNNGTYDDVIYIGPGNIVINKKDYTNSASIDCKPNTVGYGGRLNAAAVPNTQWSKMSLYLTPSLSPTAEKKFDCFLSDSTVPTNAPSEYVTYTIIPRIWDSTASRYRNLKNAVVYGGKFEAAINNTSAGVYGNEIATFSTDSAQIIRVNTCRRIYLNAGLIPDKMFFTIMNYDFSSIEIFSDSDCSKKIHTIASAVNGANILPILPTTRSNGFFMKGVLNGANTGTPSSVFATLYSFRVVATPNKD